MTTSGKSNRNEVAQGRPAMLALFKKGRMEEADVAMLRREIFLDRSPSRIEIEDLLGLDAVLRPDIEAWTEFLVDAVTDHVVWDLRPTGTVDEAQARWLIDKVDASKTVSSFAILVNILDEAHRVPRWFEGAVRTRAVSDWPGLRSSVEQAMSASAV